LRFACAAAAIKCTRFGGIAGAPARREVEAFLAVRRAAPCRRDGAQSRAAADAPAGPLTSRP